MTKKKIEGHSSVEDTAVRKSTVKKAVTKTNAAADAKRPTQRGSIFDEAFGPIGSERRKPWSRLDRKRV